MSQIENFNCAFELCCEFITKYIDYLGKCGKEVYSSHGGEFESYWYQKRSSQYPVNKERRKDLMIGEDFILVYVCSNKEDDLNTIQKQYSHLIRG